MDDHRDDDTTRTIEHHTSATQEPRDEDQAEPAEPPPYHRVDRLGTTTVEVDGTGALFSFTPRKPRR